VVGARGRRSLGVHQLQRGQRAVEDESSSFDITDYIGTSRVLGLTTIIAAANVVLLTAIATLGAFLYNLAAALLGGLEVTLAEDVR
jgi:hypothetical protein